MSNRRKIDLAKLTEVLARDIARPLTEAEYAASLPARTDAIAAEMNERLSGVLPEGMRFEWETPREP